MKSVVDNLKYSLDRLEDSKLSMYGTYDDLRNLRQISQRIKSFVDTLIKLGKLCPGSEIVSIEEFIKGKDFLNIPDFQFVDPRFRFFLGYPCPKFSIDHYTLFQDKNIGPMSVYAASTTAAAFALLYKIYELSNLDIKNDLGLISKPVVGVFSNSWKSSEIAHDIIVEKLQSSNYFKSQTLVISHSRIDINKKFSIMFFPNVDEASCFGLSIISGWVYGHNDGFTELEKRIMSILKIANTKFSGLLLLSD